MPNLALTPEEAKREYGECIASPDAENLPKYPYGLTLYLDDDTLKKIGLTGLPTVGTTMPATVTLKVTGTSQRATQSANGGQDTRTCIDMQITDMDITPPQKSAADVLYGQQG